MWLTDKNEVYLHGKKIAEVLLQPLFKGQPGGLYVVRNLRPQGVVGVCFTSKDKERVGSWLNQSFPGWKKKP